MRINELVLFNEPGNGLGHIPFVSPEAVKKVVKMGDVFLGHTPLKPWPRISMWTMDPTKNPEKTVLMGAVHLDKLDSGFTVYQVPTIEPEFRKKGYGIYFYEYGLDYLNLKVQSDDVQTPGSALIWSKLARNSKYTVYGVGPEGEKVPVIADGLRLFVGDHTVYDSPQVQVLRCVKKK